MLGSRQQIASLQSDFYRRKFRKTLHWLMITVVIILLLIVTIIYLAIVQPSRQFYANTTDGIIIDMPRPQ